jgi:hypothetical protein
MATAVKIRLVERKLRGANITPFPRRLERIARMKSQKALWWKGDMQGVPTACKTNYGLARCSVSGLNLKKNRSDARE